MGKSGFRATILHCIGSPYTSRDGAPFYQHFADGLLVVENGLVVAVGDYAVLRSAHPDLVDIVDYRGKWLLPGLVDVHLHYPQLEVMASCGEKLLTWLNRYTFPAEGRFRDASHAEAIAELFLRLLLERGTTSALSFATNHEVSVEAIFSAAQSIGMRLAAGKVMMDRNAPDYLLEEPEACYEKCAALIEKWHGRGRISYAITPRFAPTSSEKSLAAASRLHETYPDCPVQTHLAENRSEGAWVKALFPAQKSYLEVYDHFGLVGPRSIFAHAIHLSRGDYELLADRGGSIAFCPSSNLFLGSGLFDLKKAISHRIPVALASDIGGGTSLSMLRTIEDGYKVCQLKNHLLAPLHALYHATLGGAEALGMADLIGSLQQGREADFILLDPDCHPLLALRMQACEGDLANAFLALVILGGDLVVESTYVRGQRLFAREFVRAFDRTKST